MCLTFDQKAKMIKLKEEGMMKAEKGQKLALILFAVEGLLSVVVTAHSSGRGGF